MLRQDPETQQLVLLCEKPDSLAAQILPLIDAADGELPDSTIQPVNTSFEDSIAVAREILTHFRDGNAAFGFQGISDLADLLLASGHPLAGINPIFSRVVTALEQQDQIRLVEILESELIPALSKF